MEYVDDATIEGCKLFGCGTIGIRAMTCNNLGVAGTEIYQCSSGGCWFFGCSEVRVDECNIHDIDGMELYKDYFCTDILVDGAPIIEE